METRGFTLIELSIVLVIIGLIVGGVLVGRDLIRAAEYRGTISQIEKFDTAAQTFKLKYGALPGDMYPATAVSLGLFEITGTCTTCRFGDGIINNSSGGNNPEEYYVFWRHLSEANLIEGRYGVDATNPIVATTGSPTSMAAGYKKLFLPEAKMKGYYFYAAPGFRVDLSNGAIGTAVPWTDYNISSASGSFVPATLVYAIDSKIDDGKPNSGRQFDYAGQSFYFRWGAAPGVNHCTAGGTVAYGMDVYYNINPSTGGNADNCYPFIKAGF